MLSGCNYDITPLHWAASEHQRNVEILQYLISQRADLNAKRYDGLTPLDVADTDEKREILRAAGARLSSEL